MIKALRALCAADLLLWPDMFALARRLNASVSLGFKSLLMHQTSAERGTRSAQRIERGRGSTSLASCTFIICWAQTRSRRGTWSGQNA